MTWSETKRRWRVMREIEELFVADPTTKLPWTEEYVELFGDREGLVAALRYRWQLARDTQLDSHVPEAALDEQRIRMDQRTRTMLRILDTVASRDQGGDRAVA
jgi:hypothetical protein